MTRFHRVSQAVIALSLLGATLAAGAPTITSQPRDKYGNTASILDVHEDCALYLKIEAVGTGPVTYQWKKNGVNVNAAGRGPTNEAILNLIPSFLTDAGAYTCVVTDSTGTEISNTIQVAAVDIRQRGVLALPNQKTATLKVDAAGTGLKFKWYRRSLASGEVVDQKLLTSMSTKFSGIALNTLTVKNVTPDDVGQYYCRVFFNGFSMDGGHQNLAVVPTPSSQLVRGGETLNLNVEPLGVGNFDSVTYQWKKGTSTLAGNPSATTATLTVDEATLADGGTYTCTVGGVVRGKAVPAVTTAATTAFVVDHRDMATLAAVGASPILTFSPPGAATTHTYQWFKKENGGGETLLTNSTLYTGVTTAALKINKITVNEAGDYFCRVTAYGSTADTGLRRLAVLPVPGSRSGAIGDDVELQVLPVGAEEFSSLAYQWKKGTDLLASNPTRNNDTLVLEDLVTGSAGTYTCTVSGIFNGLPVVAATTGAATVFVVNNTPEIVMAAGATSPALTFTPPGSPTTHTYRWYSKVGDVETALEDGADYLGTGTAKLTIKLADADDAVSYFCRVTAYGDTSDAGLRSLIILPPPASTTVAAGAPAQLTVLPAGADPATIAAMTFQWKRGKEVLLTQTEQTLSIPSTVATDAADYTCMVTAPPGITTIPGGGTVTSPIGKIALVESLEKRTLALEGATATLSITASTAVGQTYQWYKVGTGGNPDTELSPLDLHYAGVATKVLSVKLVTPDDAGDYYCKVTSYGEDANSGFRRLVVIPKPASHTVLVGQPLQVEVSPVGAPLGDFTFQWKQGKVLRGTDSFHAVGSASHSDAGDYSCVVTLVGVGTVTTPAAKVLVVESNSYVRLSPTGLSPTLPLTTTGAGATYKWYRVIEGEMGPQLTDAAKYPGFLTKTLTIKLATVADAGEYRCIVSAYGQQVQAASFTLVLVPPPSPKLVAAGTSQNLQIVPVGGEDLGATPSYEWKKGKTILADGVMPGVENGLTDSLTFPDVQLTHAGAYVCTVTLPGALPASVVSPVGYLNVVNTTPTSKMVAQGATAVLTIAATGTGNTFRWYKTDGETETELTDITKFVGITTPKLTVKACTLPDAGTYFCRVSAHSGQTVDGGLQRLVVVAPPSSVLIDRGTNLNLEVQAAGLAAPEDLTYQWTKGKLPLAEETASVLSIANAQLVDAGDYFCTVTLAGVTPALKTAVAKVSVVERSAALSLAVKTLDGKLSVAIGGKGQTYKWYRKGAPPGEYLENSTKYLGATAAVLTVKATTDEDAGEYVCEVSAFGRTVAICDRILEVVTSPASTMVPLGSPLSLEVTTTGTISGLTYQWKKGKALLAASSVLSIPSTILTDASAYTCVVSVEGALPVTTKPTLVAVADLFAKNWPVNLTKTAVLKASAAGAGLGYKWYRMVEGAEVALEDSLKHLKTATAALSIVNSQVEDMGDYVCKISANGLTFTTAAQTLLVHRAPVLGDVAPDAGIVGGAYSYQIPIGDDPLRQPTKYTVTGLPTGLVINATTGLISGRPTLAVTDRVLTISAINAVGTDTKAVSITIHPLSSHLAGSYAGPIPPDEVLNQNYGGALEMTVTTTGAISGKLYLGAAVRAFTGILNVLGDNPDTATATATVTVSLGKGVTPLTMTFNIGTDNLLTDGVLTDGENSVEFYGWRNKFSLANPATGFAGLHNFGMGLPEDDPNENNPAVPQGVGIGTFTVNANGTLSIGGNLSDGTAVTAATFVGPDGQIVLYKTLYATAVKGYVAAELAIQDQDTPDSADNLLTGSGIWSRPEDPSTTQRTYKDGFGPVNLVFEGGRYTPPVAPKVTLGLDAGQSATLRFVSGGVETHGPANPNVTVVVQAGNVMTLGSPNATSATIATSGSGTTSTATTGKFSGTFKLNSSGGTLNRACTYFGIIYPTVEGLMGAGYALIPQEPNTTSPIRSGAVFFEK